MPKKDSLRERVEAGQRRVYDRALGLPPGSQLLGAQDLRRLMHAHDRVVRAMRSPKFRPGDYEDERDAHAAWDRLMHELLGKVAG